MMSIVPQFTFSKDYDITLPHHKMIIDVLSCSKSGGGRIITSTYLSLIMFLNCPQVCCGVNGNVTLCIMAIVYQIL